MASLADKINRYPCSRLLLLYLEFESWQDQLFNPMYLVVLQEKLRLTIFLLIEQFTVLYVMIIFHIIDIYWLPCNV